MIDINVVLQLLTSVILIVPIIITLSRRMVSTSSQVSISSENNTRETTRNENENDDVPPPSYSPPPYSPGEYGRRLQQVERASIRRRLSALIDLTRRQQERMSSRVARSTRVEESGIERVPRSRPRVKITLRGNRHEDRDPRDLLTRRVHRRNGSPNCPTRLNYS